MKPIYTKNGSIKRNTWLESTKLTNVCNQSSCNCESPNQGFQQKETRYLKAIRYDMMLFNSAHLAPSSAVIKALFYSPQLRFSHIDSNIKRQMHPRCVIKINSFKRAVFKFVNLNSFPKLFVVTNRSIVDFRQYSQQCWGLDYNVSTLNGIQ